MPRKLSNYVFVTVGTTMFDNLHKVVDDPVFHTFLKQQGYDGLLMQIGETNFVPKYAVEETLVTEDEPDKDFRVYYYRTKPSIAEDIRGATFVISHAGSGSMIEILQAQKPVVVVINTLLMNNHQEELAKRLSAPDDKYVLLSSPAYLRADIEMNLSSYIKTRKMLTPVDNSKFGNFLMDKFTHQGDDTTSQQASTQQKRSSREITKKKVKTMVVVGSGGHTAEMFQALEAVSTDVFTPRCYVLAATDKRSEDKVIAFETKVGNGTPDTSSFTVKRIPRSRHVGQSYFTSIWTTIVSFFFCLGLLRNEKPDLLLVNGPGTCVPVVLSAIFYRFFRICRTRIVYIESVARVHGLSLSCRILHRLVDWLIIQWPELFDRVSSHVDVWVKNFFFPIADH